MQMNNNMKRLFLEIVLYLIFNLISTMILRVSLSIISQVLLLFIVVGIARKVFPDK